MSSESGKVLELSADILSSTVAQGSLAVADCDGDGVTAAARFMMCSSHVRFSVCQVQPVWRPGLLDQARVCHE